MALTSWNPVLRRASGSGPLSTLWSSFFSIYEKLIQFCAIDELGTNYPKVRATCRGGG